MINYIKSLIFEEKLKKYVNILLIQYTENKITSFWICYDLELKNMKFIDYKLRRFKKLYFKNNWILKEELLTYYQNMLIYYYYQSMNYFYDQEDHLKWL